MAFQKGNKFSAGRSAWNKGKHILVKCENCGTELDRLEKTADKRQFCNHKCHSDWKIKQTHVKVSCAFCGTEISRHKKRVEAAELSFCSKDCFAQSPHGKFQNGNTVNSGRTPWNKGRPHMQGEDHPLYGIGHTQESIEKMRKSHEGIRPSDETWQKLMRRVPWNKGKKWQDFRDQPHNRLGVKHTEETKRKMIQNHADFSGENHPMYGKTPSEEHRKHNSESHIGLQAGEKHPNYIDGRSFEPYCSEFNEPLKELVRERDGRICQFPGCGVKEDGKKHAAHHIDYNKKNPQPILITLCTKHNSVVNSNRTYWEQYFMDILKQRGFIKEKEFVFGSNLKPKNIY